MQTNFLQALKEHAMYIGGFLDKLRKDSNEQFDKLRAEVRDGQKSIQLDITPRAIEQLQDNANININKAVQAIVGAANLQTDNLNRVTQAIQQVTDAIKTDTSEAYLLRQSNQKLTALSESVEKLTKIMADKDSKEELAALKELQVALKKLDKEPEKLDIAPITNGLKLMTTEMKDMAKSNEQAFGAIASGMTKMGEALGGLKFDFPKEFKLNEQQVRKLAGSRGVSTIPSKNATDVTIANVALTNSGTEYSYTFPSNTVSWTFKLRDAGATLYYAYAANSTPANGSPYMTLLPGLSARSQDNLEWSGKTIYFETDTNTQVVELEIFTL